MLFSPARPKDKTHVNDTVTQYQSLQLHFASYPLFKMIRKP